MVDDVSWVIVGRFGKPHGIKGFVTVQSFTEPFDNILQYNNWHIRQEGRWQPVTLQNIEPHNKILIAQVDGYPGRELVARLTNVEIAIDQKQLAQLEPGNYYWHDLIGMTVINTKGEQFGTVKEIIPTGSNDVLVVMGEKRHLIPYLPKESVLSIDDHTRTITVDWDMDF